MWFIMILLVSNHQSETIRCLIWNQIWKRKTIKLPNRMAQKPHNQVPRVSDTHQYEIIQQDCAVLYCLVELLPRILPKRVMVSSLQIWLMLSGGMIEINWTSSVKWVLGNTIFASDEIDERRKSPSCYHVSYELWCMYVSAATGEIGLHRTVLLSSLLCSRDMDASLFSAFFIEIYPSQAQNISSACFP